MEYRTMKTTKWCNLHRGITTNHFSYYRTSRNLKNLFHNRLRFSSWKQENGKIYLLCLTWSELMNLLLVGPRPWISDSFTASAASGWASQGGKTSLMNKHVGQSGLQVLTTTSNEHEYSSDSLNANYPAATPDFHSPVRLVCVCVHRFRSKG